ncbi:SCO family protein [Vibrio renipiscarius]|uniref:Photosynthetic protein synthase I n=1 Tax=Vibrio renipiscarius TaxID=1461322 RepID=A0A0C2NQ37_9VIBR|nr:SCO family protein [Vibrio renipiscarius]KII76287.1 photosynthetic protein synthase I [Vibrio renipiscarius]KII78191.1 photosynthetic protein synthase I [Vibrio renipiscarius]
MSKNWSLILITAFVLGYGLKVFLDHQPSDAIHNETSLDVGSLDVELQGKGNRPVQLFDAADTRTRVVYFGFTHCPDVCPTSLAMLAAALNQLDPQTRAQLRPTFITLDPARDDGKVAHTYAQYFHPQIDGLSGDIATIQTLANRYGVVFKRTELSDSEMKYTLDHNSYFYFLAPDGTLITKVSHTLTPAPLMAAIETLNQK